MESPVESPYPHSRTPRACEACRGSKTRCLISDDPKVCQRCLKSQIRCIFSTEPRTRRPPRRHSIGSKRNVSLKPQDRFPYFEPRSSTFAIDLPPTSSLNTSEDLAILEQYHDANFQCIMPSPTCQKSSPEISKPYPTPSTTEYFPPGGSTASQPIIDSRTLTLSEADSLLNIFRDMNPFFPFVIIQTDATTQSLAQNSPFLLLSILTAASGADMHLQYQLEQEFKRVLGSKVVIDGQKSLDFLQGLLVYLAWYPSHLKPRHQQALMYMHLAISLATDLGLDQQHPHPNNSIKRIESNGLIVGSEFSKDAQRAYMGCYYLSATLAIAFQKPNSMEYNGTHKYFGHCLALSSEGSSDTSLISLLESQRILESIHESLPPDNSPSDTSALFQQDIRSQSFQNEVDMWAQSMSNDLKLLPLIGLTDKFLRMTIYSHHLGCFHRSASPHNNQIISPNKLSHCLTASSQLFNYLLSLPTSQYSNLTAMQWATIIKAIIILCRLSFPVPGCHDWDFIAARDAAPLGMYLDSLCYRMQCLSSTKVPQEGMPENIDAPFVFKTILDNVRRKFAERVALTPSTNKTTAIRHTETSEPVARDEDSTNIPMQCPMVDLDLLAYFDMWQASLAEQSHAGDTSKIPLYHDLWATMTVSWAGQEHGEN